MSDQKPIATYYGFDIFRLQDGTCVFRRPGDITHGAKTLTASFGAIRKLAGKAPKSTGAVLPDSPTYRLGREAGENLRRAELDKESQDGK